METYALFRAYLSELSDSMGFGFVLLMSLSYFTTLEITSVELTISS